MPEIRHAILRNMISAILCCRCKCWVFVKLTVLFTGKRHCSTEALPQTISVPVLTVFLAVQSSKAPNAHAEQIPERWRQLDHFPPLLHRHVDKCTDDAYR